MPQDNANLNQLEVIREADCFDDVSVSSLEEAAAIDTRMNFGSLPNRTLDEYRESAWAWWPSNVSFSWSSTAEIA